MKLILSPENYGRSISCDLMPEKSGGRSGILAEDIRTYREYVLSDMGYIIFVETEQELRKLKFRVNGELISGFFVTSLQCGPHQGEFRNTSQEYENMQWFRDCCGFARVEIENEEEGIVYCSDYLEVMIPQNQKEMYGALQNMAAYVSRMNRRYLSSDERKSALSGDLRDGKKHLRDKISLLQEISETYERNCGFFRSSPCSRLDSGWHVDDFRKLQYLSPVTMDYIVGHPDDLIPTDSSYGIRVENRSYIPSKTLVRNAEPSRDCYENTVLMGFFELLFQGMENLTSQITAFQLTVPLSGARTEGYESSAGTILNVRRDDLTQDLAEIQALQKSLQMLYWKYKIFLPVEPLRMTELPMPTPVFLSVEPYRQIYELIHRWFGLGNTDIFHDEKFLVPLTLNYSLYEYYVLCKIAETLESQGLPFVPEESFCFHYEIPDKRYSHLDHTNTFVFRKGERKATLYYQPVIYTHTANPEMRNGLELCRATTLGIKSTTFPDWADAFYTPDYVVKIENKEGCAYLIGDAKFRTFSTSQIPDLVFKYHFSLRPLSSRDRIAGTTIFYGKNYAAESSLHSLYDVFYDSTTPDFSYAFLTESPACTTDSQQQMLAELLKFANNNPTDI